MDHVPPRRNASGSSPQRGRARPRRSGIDHGVVPEFLPGMYRVYLRTGAVFFFCFLFLSLLLCFASLCLPLPCLTLLCCCGGGSERTIVTHPDSTYSGRNGVSSGALFSLPEEQRASLASPPPSPEQPGTGEQRTQANNGLSERRPPRTCCLRVVFDPSKAKRNTSPFE